MLRIASKAPFRRKTCPQVALQPALHAERDIFQGLITVK